MILPDLVIPEQIIHTEASTLTPPPSPHDEEQPVITESVPPSPAQKLKETISQLLGKRTLSQLVLGTNPRPVVLPQQSQRSNNHVDSEEAKVDLAPRSATVCGPITSRLNVSRRDITPFNASFTACDFLVSRRELSAPQPIFAASSATGTAPSAVAVSGAQSPAAQRPAGLSDSFRDIFLETHSLQHAQQLLDKDILRAAGTGKVHALARLLESPYANPNCSTTHRMTPLHYAAAKGYFEVAELLLQAGADPWAQTVLKKTPLDLAMAGGHESVVSLLKLYAKSRTVEKDEVLLTQAMQGKTLAGRTGGRGAGLLHAQQQSAASRVVAFQKKPAERAMSLTEYLLVSVDTDEVEGPFYSRYQTYAVSVRASHPLFGERNFTVKRRFRDLVAFYESLVNTFRAQGRDKIRDTEMHRELVLWRPRKLLFGSTAPTTVEQRRNAFEHLLRLAASDRALIHLVINFLSP